VIWLPVTLVIQTLPSCPTVMSSAPLTRANFGSELNATGAGQAAAWTAVTPAEPL
jgi:hypothetical protein